MEKVERSRKFSLRRVKPQSPQPAPPPKLYKNMFESLSDRLDGAFKVITGSNRLTELNVAESIKEIRKILQSEFQDDKK